jgi:cytoskeletal protein RodZ
MNMANTFIFDDEEEEPQSTMESPQDYPSDEVDEEGEEEGEGSNRTFLIISIVLGVIILLTLICGTILAFTVFIPAQNNVRATETEQAMLVFGMTQSAQQTALVDAFTPTPTLTETPTLEPTATPVVLFPTETSPAVVVDPATATVQALETRLAEVNLTATAQVTAGTATPAAGTGTPSPTTLSQTGFADEVGLPGLFIAALILVAVILLARRLRQTPLAR